MDDEKIIDAGMPEQNFNENPDEDVPLSSRREIIKPIYPHKKITSRNEFKNKQAHLKKEMSNRKRKNKQARAARRKNRR